MTQPTDKITKNGQTLTARMWQLLEDAYTAAGMDPDRYLVVTQGSYKGGSGASASGSTHDGGGAADLRTWNLPASQQANLCQNVVVELRKRNGCAWYRDQAHGGFDPHIHVIVRDEPALSSGARWQVSEYDRVHNGLSNQGPDYHPRPIQRPYQFDDGGTPPAPTPSEDDDMPIILVKGKQNKLLSGNEMANISQASADALKEKGGLKIVGIPNDDWPALEAAFGANTG
jgi:hypothetical protein